MSIGSCLHNTISCCQSPLEERKPNCWLNGRAGRTATWSIEAYML